jgi:hypothetical protein
MLKRTLIIAALALSVSSYAQCTSGGCSQNKEKQSCEKAKSCTSKQACEKKEACEKSCSEKEESAKKSCCSKKKRACNKK